MGIRVPYQVDRMVGSGEVIGKLQTLWDELLNHGDEFFVLSFPPVRGVHPSLTLKVAIVHACASLLNTHKRFWLNAMVDWHTTVG